EIEIQDSKLALRNLLEILGAYVSLTGYQRYQVVSDMIESVAEDQTFAVRRSELAEKERSALIGLGTERLAGPHDGGFNSPNIANIMRGVQIAASAVIMVN